MNIALARVDSRLVHGQIVESWIPATRASVLMVANDDVARDAWRSSLMQACVPENVRVQVSRVEELNQLLTSHRTDAQNVILLFANIRDALAAHVAGVPFSQLNLGNVHEHPGSHAVTPTVFLSSDDMEQLRSLVARGVDIEIRTVSRDRPIPSHQFLR